MMWIWCTADLPDDDREVVVTDGYDPYMGVYVRSERYTGWSTHQYAEWEKDSSVIAWCDIPRYPTFQDYLDYGDKTV